MIFQKNNEVKGNAGTDGSFFGLRSDERDFFSKNKISRILDSSEALGSIVFIVCILALIRIWISASPGADVYFYPPFRFINTLFAARDYIFLGFIGLYIGIRLLRVVEEVTVVRRELSLRTNALSDRFDEIDGKQKKIDEKDRQANFFLQALDTAQKQIVDQSNELINERRVTTALMRELDKFTLAVDNASDQIVFSNASGEIIYANKMTERNTGYALPDIIGIKPGKLWGGHMSISYYQNMWNIIKNKKEVFIGEFLNTRKNGEKYNADVRISPVLDTKGDIQFYVAIERDITRAKEIERVKDEFVSLVSHQLRTPLTGMRWLIELLSREKKGLSKKSVDYVNSMDISTQKMIYLVDEFLNISRMELGKAYAVVPTEINITALIKEVCSEQKIYAKPNHIDIVFNQVKSAPIYIMADADKMKQVFTNLINNAVKYSKVDGTVEVGFMVEKDKVIFGVADSGIGVPEKDKELLFSKFYRASNAMSVDPHGSGLGLYIVKAIVEAHKGTISFESEVGKGTKFFFTMPL